MSPTEVTIVGLQGAWDYSFLSPLHRVLPGWLVSSTAPGTQLSPSRPHLCTVGDSSFLLQFPPEPHT